MTTEHKSIRKDFVKTLQEQNGEGLYEIFMKISFRIDRGNKDFPEKINTLPEDLL